MLSRALEGFSSYLAALLELSFWFVITFSPWQYWISYSFYMLSFWCYCSLFFLAVASASDDCYSNPLWFLQLWQRGQRIHSAFHQIYTGQCTLFFSLFWGLILILFQCLCAQIQAVLTMLLHVLVQFFIILLAEYGSFWGSIVLHWDEELHS